MRIFGLLLGFACVSAGAADWKPLIESVNRSLFIDTTSVVKSGKYVKAWFMDDSKIERAGEPSSNFKGYKSTRKLVYFSCEERTSASLQILYYSEGLGGGDFLGSWAIKLPSAQFDDVAPDTYGERMLNVACKIPLATR